MTNVLVRKAQRLWKKRLPLSRKREGLSDDSKDECNLVMGIAY